MLVSQLLPLLLCLLKGRHLASATPTAITSSFPFLAVGVIAWILRRGWLFWRFILFLLISTSSFQQSHPIFLCFSAGSHYYSRASTYLLLFKEPPSTILSRLRTVLAAHLSGPHWSRVCFLSVWLGMHTSTSTVSRRSCSLRARSLRSLPSSCCHRVSLRAASSA